MARKNSYTFDTKKKEWSKNTTNEPDKKSENKGGDSSGTKNEVKNNTDNLTSTDSSKDGSTGKVEKKYNDIEINTLTGSLNFIVNEKTIKLKVGDTVNLVGLGKYLSGNYYVQEITRNISSSGYTHSATLLKTDFGKSLKIAADIPPATTKTEEKPVESTTTAQTAQRTYTVKKGDCLWKIAKQFYGNGAEYTKIFNANRDKIKNPDLIYTGQVFVIP
nr:MAG TPA: tail assembly protein [Caudoviricetes sp.]